MNQVVDRYPKIELTDSCHERSVFASLFNLNIVLRASVSLDKSVKSTIETNEKFEAKANDFKV